MNQRTPSSSDGSIETAASAWIARRDAGMTAAEEDQFARWSADPRHARALARHEQAWQLFDRPREAGVGAQIAGEFRARLARRRRRGIAIAAASMMLALGAGTLWRARQPEAIPVQKTAAANASVVRPEQRTLPDGSVVELPRNTEIRIEFSADMRRVVLTRGEAHFTVVKDAQRRFVVVARGVEARAIGTAFAVRVDRSAVEVVVTEGRVEVEQVDGSGLPGEPKATPSAPLMLAAGNAAVVPIAGEKGPAQAPSVAPLSAEEVAERLGWRATRLEFTATPLGEAVALMNRFNDVRFEISDPEIATLEVSGFFRADNAATFLRLIEQSLGVRGERRGQTIVLRKAR